MNKLLSIALLILLFGCQSINEYRLNQQIEEHKLFRHTIAGNNFNLIYFANNLSGSSMHIYIEGDGRPWLNRNTIANDPTPKNLLTLALMTQDKTNAIYLARPCYFNLHSNQTCTPDMWTSGRYSETVVASMQNAIEKIIDKEQLEEVVLIGYSGGGVLASLLSKRIAESKFYVTIAANLDIQKWTEHHNYSPLTDSLNPNKLTQTNIKPAIHFVGALDRVVPTKTVETFIKKTKGTKVAIDGYGHRCCWVKSWPQHLEEIETFRSTISSD